jgi:hypothetical protein
MTKYPYYIVVQLRGGILYKEFNNKKFSSIEEAEIALFNKWKRIKSRLPHFLIPHVQCLILKYTENFNCNIVKIYSPEKENNIEIVTDINNKF